MEISNSKVAELEKVIQSKTMQIKESNELVESLRSEILNLKQECERLTTAEQESAARCDKSDEEIKKLKSLVLKTNKRYEEAKKMVSQTVSEASSLKAQTDKHKEVLRSIREHWLWLLGDSELNARSIKIRSRVKVDDEWWCLVEPLHASLTEGMTEESESFCSPKVFWTRQEKLLRKLEVKDEDDLLAASKKERVILSNGLDVPESFDLVVESLLREKFDRNWTKAASAYEGIIKDLVS